MSLLVVGSVAFDSIETPHGNVDDALGGSASFFPLLQVTLPNQDWWALLVKIFPRSIKTFSRKRH